MYTFVSNSWATNLNQNYLIAEKKDKISVTYLVFPILKHKTNHQASSKIINSTIILNYYITIYKIIIQLFLICH